MISTKKLFLIDDDDIFVFITKKIIAETDFKGEIKVFGNGKIAIDYLAGIAEETEMLPEIIFLDLSMPVLDGWGFLEEFILLKPRITRTILIYIVSSSVSPQDIERANSLSHVSGFIIKPLKKEKFFDVMNELSSATIE